MGAENLPEWVSRRRPLTTEELAGYINFSPDEIRALRKKKILKAILDRRPYRFDPLHVYQVIFAPQLAQAPSASPAPELRSLTTEKRDSHSHKPVKGKDLWLD